MKTPEEYFLDNVQPPDQVGPDEAGRAAAAPDGVEPTPAEQAFLTKYMGVDEGAALDEALPEETTPQHAPGFGPASDEEEAAGAMGFDADEHEAEQGNLVDDLKVRDDMQLVSFHVAGREYTAPIETVQEVIRYTAPTALPSAPSFVVGIVNLRGRVTPLIRLSDLLGAGADGEEGFIVVCRRKGLQFGLIIDKVNTMYRVHQADIEWNVEAHLGVAGDIIAGLLKAEEGLIGILSVDRIVEKVLEG